MKVNWKYVGLYSIMVLGLSYPVQKGHFDTVYNLYTADTILYESTYLLAGCSTVISALVVLLLQKRLSNRITVFGDDIIKNLLILSLPVIAFSIVGLPNDFGINKSLFGFYFALINTLYAFAEEFGWRRYLQNALEGLKPNLKYIAISIIWWIWHFRFDTAVDLFIFPLICIGGGYLLGKLADDCKSILPVVAMHTLIILTTSKGHFGQNEVLGIGFVILGWVVIEQVWKRKRVSYRA